MPRLRTIAAETGIPEIEFIRWAQGRIKTGFPPAIDVYDDHTKDFDLAEVIAWIESYRPAKITLMATTYGMTSDELIDAISKLPELMETFAEGREMLESVGLVRVKRRVATH